MNENVVQKKTNIACFFCLIFQRPIELDDQDFPGELVSQAVAKQIGSF